MSGDRNYTIYFEMFGRRMKTNIMATDRDDAIAKLLKRVTIHKVEVAKDEFNEAMDMMDMFVDNLKSKKTGK